MMSYLRINFPLGCSRAMARSAVGAVENRWKDSQWEE